MGAHKLRNGFISNKSIISDFMPLIKVIESFYLVRLPEP